MSYQVVDTTGWDWSRIEPYWADLIAALERLVARFPTDMTVEALLTEARHGERTLWLVLDESGAFVSFCMTGLRIVDATGVKIATLMDLAGESVFAAAPDICAALENWAAENGADLMAVEGREGWKRLLKNHGYEVHAVLYRKVALNG